MKVLLVPDCHFPEHEPVAQSVVVRAAAMMRPDVIIQLGDILDCAGFTTHPPKTMAEGKFDNYLEHEVKPAKAFLKALSKHTKKLVLVEGNHENRVERWAMRDKGGSAVYEMVSPRKLLADCVDKWVPYRDPLSHYEICRGLWAVHGWSYGKHATTEHLSRSSNFSIVHGHTHRIQSSTRKDPVSGRLLEAHSFGCLSKLQPLWQGANPTDWAHGFGVVYVDDTNHSHWIYTVKIENAQAILPNGKLCQADSEITAPPRPQKVQRRR